MTSIGTIWQALKRRGINLAVHDGKLQVDAPVGVLTATDKELLLQRKADLLYFLSASSPHPAADSVIGTFVSDLHLVPDTQTDRDALADWLFDFEERAGIMEFDGNLSREEAERLAGLDCGLSPTSLGLFREILEKEKNNHALA